jgi:predicted RNase H-like HicB family nuclease
MRYAVVIEKAEGNCSAHLPDALSPARPSRQLRAKIRDAIRFHFEGPRADGLPVPAPTTISDYVDA